MRELPFPEDLLLPRDDKPILWVEAQTWACPLCDPPICKVCRLTRAEHEAAHRFQREWAAVAATTVSWQGSNTDGPSGRCSTCGQKYALAHTLDKHIPSIEEQMGAPDVHP